MTSTSDRLRDWLCREAREALGPHAHLPALLLWCDPDCSWLDLLRELNDAIHKLAAFDAKLDQVARSGSATEGLKKLLECDPHDDWSSLDGKRPFPTTTVDLITQESTCAPDIHDVLRENFAPLQRAGLLSADVLAERDVERAISDRPHWRADARRWIREGKLRQPGWWWEEAGS